MKKITAILLVFCLAFLSVPTISSPVSAAEGDFFIFQGEQSTYESARVVLTSNVDLTGTLNNVIGSSVTYSVEKVVKQGASESTVPGMSRINQTANITLSGNTIKILAVQLYPGVNKITFKGLQGFAEVEGKIYIEYRDSPSLYDLKANIGTQKFDILEDKTTVIYSSASNNRDDYNISISGKAPNADRVTVIVNGRSYTYAVSATNGYSFAASPVNVVQGKNILTIRVHNGTQYVETTRDIAFYNGEVTFYDLTLTNGTKSVPLDNSPNFTVAGTDTISVKGKAIVPLKWGTTKIDWNGDGDNTDPEDLPLEPVLTVAGMQLNVALDGAWGGGDGPTVLDGVSPAVANLTSADSYVTVEFSRQIDSASDLTFTAPHSLTFRGLNVNKVAPDNIDESKDFSFHLRDDSAPFIQELNYLPGFKAGLDLDDLTALTGSPMEGAVVPALPLGVELLIGGNLPATVPTVTLNRVLNSSGTPIATGFSFTQLNTGTDTVYVTKSIDGVDQQFHRVFLQIDQLPTSGTLTLEFDVSGVKKSAKISLLYGPFAQYNNLYDNMEVRFDTTSTDGQEILLEDTFDFFKGTLQNVSNPATIFYENQTPNLQTVFFYINNIEVKLEMSPLDENGNPNSDKRKFQLDDTASNLTKAYDAIFKGGENVVKFVYRTTTNNYVKETKFNIVPTNLPVIPVEGKLGVFPYSTNRDQPMENDPNFELRGTVYSTTEARMNIYGTFDFVDLGETPLAVGSKLTQPGFNPDNYILVIQTAGETPREWDLSEEFFAGSDTYNAGIPSDGIRVSYDYESQSFAFLLTDESLPLDGSAKVYTITVFNSGKSGPRAQYRLEIDPTNIPYTVLAPIAEKRIVNQSFVDVILFSEGADRIEIDGQEAKKITYLDYKKDPNGEPTNAYMATVSGLKANKPTEIEILIANGEDEIEDSITVTYTPENIPGAQVMEKMKTSHKLFSGALSLKFPGGTNLIRRDYNATSPFKNQVYAGNDLLFAIANPTDGVVERHDFETKPAGYDLQVDLGEVYFSASFPDRFIKSSPVFWIDGGQADDAASSSPEYNPVTRGYDPMPFEIIEGDEQAFFYNRDPDRELVPSKRGELTLSYDPSVRQSAGVTVSVFRFDPYVKQWENIGGTVDEKKNTITVPFDRFGYYVVGKLSYGYNDITDHRYAREAIEAVYTKGVMNPMDPAGTFGTDQYVTRAEFARMLVRALEMPLNYDGPKHFLDIGDTGDAISLDAVWDYRYIETAARAGFVKGTQPRVFEPTNHITRQDASVMLAKALNMKLDTNLPNIRKQLQKSFKDEASIDVYAKPSVAAILKKGFINGSPVDSSDPSKGFVFEPTSRLLRSDAAIIIAKVMTDLDKLPSVFNGQE